MPGARWAKLPGFTVFVADLLKGMVGVYLGMLLVGTSTAMIIGGIMGDCRPFAVAVSEIQRRQRRGDGTGRTDYAYAFVSAIVFLVWLVVVLISKYVSLGSIIAAVLVPVCAFLTGLPLEFVLFGIVAAIFVIYRHKSNIVRLMNGTENKIKAGSR